MKKTNAIHAHLILSFVLLPVVSTAFIDGVTQEQILRLLNSVRSRVVPTASRMVQLQWNASLAASAARYASTQCNGGFRSNPTCAGCSNYIGDAEYPSYGSQGILDVIEGNFLVQVGRANGQARVRTYVLTGAWHS
ncbi:SCP domain-containing protein [Plasmodiophora brassicae]